MRDHICRVCGKPMILLDKDVQRYYCSKDDEVWLGKEQRWLRQIAHNTGNVYDAFYVDGYRNLTSTPATISLSKEGIEITFSNIRSITKAHEASEAFKLEIPYASIEVLNITQEREITALRTLLFTGMDRYLGTKSGLMGSVLAAWNKKKTLNLTIGVREKDGLLQLPSFKMETSIIDGCYEKLYERVQKSRAE